MEIYPYIYASPVLIYCANLSLSYIDSFSSTFNIKGTKKQEYVYKHFRSFPFLNKTESIRRVFTKKNVFYLVMHKL